MASITVPWFVGLALMSLIVSLSGIGIGLLILTHVRAIVKSWSDVPMKDGASACRELAFQANRATPVQTGHGMFDIKFDLRWALASASGPTLICAYDV
jgi:hypothetical protein